MSIVSGRMKKKVLALAGVGLFWVSCGSMPSPTAPTSPLTSNRAPVIRALTVSPSGIGLASATIFTFLGENVVDPDGDTLTFSWLSSDGASVASSAAAASHTYANPGLFEMRLTATDARGLSASATVSVRVGEVDGIWDVSCENRNAESIRLWPNFPSRFVVTLQQIGGNLHGSMTGGGRTRAFTYSGTVSNSRRLSFGFETTDNVWANRDGDFYFHMDADDSLTSMRSRAGSFYCPSSVARKR